MRILVGTLSCGENEYEQCCASIRNQTHKDWEHITIENLPNKQAHDSLYSAFMERSADFDLFVKVDADMVLCRDTFFSEVVDWMQQHPQIDNLQVLVHDYFSDQLIGGLHTYRSSVRWTIRDESVFVDDCPVPIERRSTDKRLAPAANHCPDPSMFQSFHFGMHKGVKVRAAIRDPNKRDRYLGNHLINIEQTYRHFLRRKDKRLALASVGAELAVQGQLLQEHVDYNNPEAAKRLSLYQECSVDELADELTRLRQESQKVIPNRCQAIRRFRWKSRFRRVAVTTRQFLRLGGKAAR